MLSKYWVPVYVMELCYLNICVGSYWGHLNTVHWSTYFELSYLYIILYIWHFFLKLFYSDNQNYSFFQRARNNSIPEEEDEEERDDSDLVKKRVNFDIFGDVSSSSGHAASYYDAECQTEV